MNVTDCFIEGLVAKQAMPKHVVEQTKRCLLDYIGVLFGGRRYVRDVHPELFESFDKAFPCGALINGFCAHVLELDDGHRHGMIHLGASIITSVIEAAKTKQVSYDRLLYGIVMGYEVAVRCARSIQPGHKVRGYHVSGTCGTIGSAMGVAFTLGYNEAQLKSTLACAVSSAAGILEIQEQASELKPFNVGRAAMDGVVAAQIGKLAFSGPDDILGGKHGFLAALTDTPKPEFLTDFGDEDYAIEGIYQKVYAACRHCHPAIEATLSLRNDVSFSIDDIEKIEVHTYRLAVDSHNHTDIKSISSAKLSTPYSVALALVKGGTGHADYNEENLYDNCILNITRKVRVIEDADLTQRSPAVRGSMVTLHLKNGDVLEATCLFPKGEPENPMSQEDILNKFYECGRSAGVTETSLKRISEMILEGDDLPVSDLMKFIS